MRMFSVAIALLVGTLALAACASQPVSVFGTPVAAGGGRYMNVSPAQLRQMFLAKDLILVNVHVPYVGELAQTDIFLPYTDIEANPSKLASDKNAKIVLYCSSGHMSGLAATTLIKLGYTNIWNLDGGMAAWQNAGYPLVQNKR